MATESSSAPSPVSLLFARGVIARLAVWPAMRIAVDQGWGGSDSASKRTWLASILVDAFEEEDTKPDVTYVELTLLQVMEDEFDTVLEDGSAEAVAKDIVGLWEDVHAGDFRVLQYEEQAERTKGKRVQAEEAAADNSDWEDETEDESDGNQTDEVPALMEAEVESTQPVEVDEDGFTVVKGKGKRHR